MSKLLGAPVRARRLEYMADLQQLFQLGQQMQGRLQELQTELAHHIVETTSGGGLVRVTVDGRGTIRALTIDPVAFDGRDAELLSDLVLAAVAERSEEHTSELQSRLHLVCRLLLEKKK